MPQQLVVEQQVASPPQDAFEAWTSPELLARWWWPHIADTTYEVDPRVAGRYRIQSLMAGIGVSGEFKSVSPPDELVMSWNWENSGVSVVQETVRVAFQSNQLGTLVRVVHEVDDIAGDAESQRQGWDSVLGRLAELLS